MDDRAVRPGARDGVEAGVAKVAAFLAEALQRRSTAINSSTSPLGASMRSSGGSGRGGAVARLGGAVAADLDLVLDRLGQDRGVALLRRSWRRPSPAPRRSRRPRARDRRRRSCPPGLRDQARSRAVRGRGRHCRDAGGHRRRSSPDATNRSAVPSSWTRAKERATGVLLDILPRTLNVQAIESRRGEHRGVGLLLRQPVGHLLALGGRGFAG